MNEQLTNRDTICFNILNIPSSYNRLISSQIKLFNRFGQNSLHFVFHDHPNFLSKEKSIRLAFLRNFITLSLRAS